MNEMKTPNIELPELSQSESPAYLNFNDGFRALDAVVQLTVQSRSLSTPPDVEQGVRYIIGADPDDDWLGHANHLAYKTASGWDFRVPRKGWTAAVLDESVDGTVRRVYFDGTQWGSFALAASDVQITIPGSPTEYGTLQDEIERLGSLSIDDLSDVNTSSTPPSNGQVLTWSSPNSSWVPATSSSGSSNVTPDTHPVSANNADDEFEVGSVIDTSGSRFSGATPWAWRNQGASTATLSDGHLIFTGVAQTSSNLRILEQSASGSTWKYRTKLTSVRIGQTKFSGCGLCVVNSSSGKVIAFYKIYSTVSGTDCWTISGDKWNSVTSYGSSLATGFRYDDSSGRAAKGWTYLEIEQTSTQLIFRFSDSGVSGTFSDFATENLATFITSVDKIGLIAHNDTGSNQPIGIYDWFRKVA